MCVVLTGIGIVLFSLALVFAEKSRLHDMRPDLHARKDELFQVIEDAEVLVEELNRFSEYTVTRCEEKDRELQETILRAEQVLFRMNAETAGLSPLRAPVMVRVKEVDTPERPVEGVLSVNHAAASAENRRQKRSVDSSSVSGETVDRADAERFHNSGSESEVCMPLNSSTQSDALALLNASAQSDALTLMNSSMESETFPSQKSNEAESADDAVAKVRQTGRGRVLNADFKRSSVMDLQRLGMDSTEIARRLQLGKGEIELIQRIGK